jgi:hypothetical protein
MYDGTECCWKLLLCLLLHSLQHPPAYTQPKVLVTSEDHYHQHFNQQNSYRN